MSEERQPIASNERASIIVPSFELFEKAAQIPCGEPDSYGATPLDHSLAYAQQSELLENLQHLVETDIPEGVPVNIVEHMKDTFAARFIKRGTANYENYLSSLRSCSEYQDDPVASEVLLRAKLGYASPAELLIVRKMLEIRSIELACLTHPYGKRLGENLENINEMRDVVRQSVELLQGTYDDEPETRYRVKEVVNWKTDNFSDGFLMTRKRTLGRLPDGTIIRERTSFVIRTDENGAVPQQNIDAIKQLGATNESWQDALVRAGRLDVIAEELLSADAFDLVIPVSTTIYAFNPETARLIDIRQKVEAMLRHREEGLDADIYPELSKQRAAFSEDRRVKNIGGMLFVGPDTGTDTDE